MSYWFGFECVVFYMVVACLVFIVPVGLSGACLWLLAVAWIVLRL